MTLPADWIAHLQQTPLPVRAEVHRQLTALLQRDEIDQGELVGWLRRDPGACGFVMGSAARVQRTKQRDAPHSLDHALSLLGDTWSRQQIPKLPILEETITDELQLAGYLVAVARSLHAARHAESWLVELRDTSYEIVVVATLLHNFIELALWRDAPELMRLALTQVRDNKISTLGHAIKSALQTEGITLNLLEKSLNDFYYLPTQLFEDEAATPILARQHQTIVLLARRISFFSEMGWYHPQIIATQKEISDLLKRDCAATDQLIHQVAVQTAREFEPMGFYSTAALLIDSASVPTHWPLPAQYGLQPNTQEQALLNFSRRATSQALTPNNLIKSLMSCLIEDLKLVEFIILSRTPSALDLQVNVNKRVSGSAIPKEVTLAENPLLARLMTGMKGLVISRENRYKLKPLLDVNGHMLIEKDCFLQSLSIKNEPFVLIVIDTRSEQDIAPIRALMAHIQTFWRF
ncbi:MAG: hypothetical protein RBR56_08795 [Halothiobacillus sp.]|jgi:hypothetical protein|nr:hypothetical protein [Halothiobacillus sp.]